MKTSLALFVGAAPVIQPTIAQPAYDEMAEAASDLQAAFETAQSSGKHVIAIFGANWCPSCRALSEALQGEAGRMLGKEFIVVKIDVGQFTKNLDIAKSYGNPIKNGIPGAVVLSADNRALGLLGDDALDDAMEDGDADLYQLFHDTIDCSTFMCKVRRVLRG